MVKESIVFLALLTSYKPILYTIPEHLEVIYIVVHR
jgi:hypothetical protein